MGMLSFDSGVNVSWRWVMKGAGSLDKRSGMYSDRSTAKSRNSEQSQSLRHQRHITSKRHHCGYW